MSFLELLCCFPLADQDNDPRRPVRSKLVISEPTLIHGGEATRSLNLVDVKVAASERSGSAGTNGGGGGMPGMRMQSSATSLSGGGDPRGI
ncbi:hypothetical protein DFH27DRAFT_616433 [Peziza echinospora]|nr:hypothetical protein DFH27DRAFT_616433 [Peziza echinospora]